MKNHDGALMYLIHPDVAGVQKKMDFSCADLLYCRKIQYNEKNDNVGGKCHDLSGIDGLLGPGRIQ